MNTSLGNGVSNVITIMYIYWSKTGDWLVAIVVEGDDSLFRLGYGLTFTPSDFADFGLSVKIEESQDVALASFCGNIFSREDKNILVDPGRIFRRVGYIDPKYVNSSERKKMSLLRAWGFSMYYMYHGCPMVSALARYVLRCTRGVYVSPDYINSHKFAIGETVPLSEERMFGLFPPNQVGMGSRAVVSLLFGFNVDQQLRVEKYLDSLNHLQPLDVPEIVSTSNEHTKMYFESHKCFDSAMAKHQICVPRMAFRDVISSINSSIDLGMSDVLSCVRPHMPRSVPVA